MNKFVAVLKQIIRLIKQNTKVFLLLCISFPVLYGVIFGSHGVIKRVSYYYENKELNEAISKEIRLQKELKARIVLLKNDKATIEKLAKERYGMVRPGETLYKIQVIED